MGIDFESVFTSASSKQEIEAKLDVLLANLAEAHSIIYVAGAVTADGEDKISENLAKLRGYCDELAQDTELASAYIFTSSHVLTPLVYQELGFADMPRTDRETAIQELFDKILESGHIAAMYLTPGWERSSGARREYETAKREGIATHFL